MGTGATTVTDSSKTAVSQASGGKYTTQKLASGGSILVKTDGSTNSLQDTVVKNSGGYANTYSGGSYSGGGSSSGGSSSSSTTWADAIKAADDAGTGNDTIVDKNASATTKELFKNAGLNMDGNVDIGKIDKVNVDEEKALLAQLKAAQEEQAKLSAQNTVDTGIKEAQRAQQDAQQQYQTTRNQIDRDEQRALDNQALYAQARGDNGGIGLAQYNSIQNAAATNRMTVQNEQTKLATDTARQIADLRAQGEFEKANQLLTISQNYLSQLMSLEQWAKEANIGIDEFNLQVDQWKENFRVSLLDAQINVANATGAFANGTPTQSAYSARQTQLANIGNTLMQAGVAPTTEMLNAMGMNSNQAVSYLNRYYPDGAK